MAAAEQSFPAPIPIAALGGRALASPYQFVTDDDDNLRVVSANSLGGVVVGIQGRMLDAGGKIAPLVHTHTPNSDRSVRTSNIKLGRGALLNLTVFVQTGAPSSGQTYVLVQLIKGFSGATIVLGTLLGGYITSNQALGYPGSIIKSSLEGEPLARFITGTDPALGVDVIETVPTGARWELLSLNATDVRDGTAAAQPIRLQLDNGASIYYQRVSQNVGGASTSNSVTFAQGVQSSSSVFGGSNLLVNEPIPPNRMLAGHRFSLTIQGGATHDDWSAPRYNVREWLEVN